jgi:hypothetical protein
MWPHLRGPARVTEGQVALRSDHPAPVSQCLCSSLRVAGRALKGTMTLGEFCLPACLPACMLQYPNVTNPRSPGDVQDIPKLATPTPDRLCQTMPCFAASQHLVGAGISRLWPILSCLKPRCASWRSSFETHCPALLNLAPRPALFHQADTVSGSRAQPLGWHFHNI